VIALRAGFRQSHLWIAATAQRPVQQRVAQVARDLTTELRRTLQPGQHFTVALERGKRVRRPGGTRARHLRVIGHAGVGRASRNARVRIRHSNLRWSTMGRGRPYRRWEADPLRARAEHASVDNPPRGVLAAATAAVPQTANRPVTIGKCGFTCVVTGRDRRPEVDTRPRPHRALLTRVSRRPWHLTDLQLGDVTAFTGRCWHNVRTVP
jgi:hypothetical protein